MSRLSSTCMCYTCRICICKVCTVCTNLEIFGNMLASIDILEICRGQCQRQHPQGFSALDSSKSYSSCNKDKVATFDCFDSLTVSPQSQRLSFGAVFRRFLQSCADSSGATSDECFVIRCTVFKRHRSEMQRGLYYDMSEVTRNCTGLETVSCIYCTVSCIVCTLK